MAIQRTVSKTRAESRTSEALLAIMAAFALAFAPGFGPTSALATVAHRQSFTVSGAVKDEAGTPIPGATVRLFEQMANDTFAERMEKMARGENFPWIKGVSTGTDGGYQIEVPSIGFWWLEINADGNAPVSHSLEQSDGDRDLGVTKLPNEQRVNLRIVDEQGKSVVGALVRVAVGRNTEDNQTAYPISQAAFSDDKGIASLWLASGVAQVDVVAAGFVPGANRGVQWKDLVGGDWSEIVLLRAQSQPVRVAVNGKPLADAVIFLEGGRLAVGRTDAAGRVMVPVPPKATKENPMPMQVEGGGLHHHFGLMYVEAEPESPSSDEPASPKDLPTTVVRIKTKKVAGQVVDAAGSAVAGALVWTTSPRSQAVQADEDGRYQLVLSSTYPNKSHRTFVQAAGSGFSRTWVELGKHQRISVDKERKLQVTVSDPNGAVVEGVELSLIDAKLLERTYQRQIYLTAVTNQKGVGQLGPLKAGVQYRFNAYRPGYKHEQQILAAANAGSEAVRELDIVLQLGATHIGWVVDEHDDAVAGAMVTVKETPVDQRLNGRSRRSDEPLVVVFTDSEGRFALTDLSAEKVDLKVRAEGFAPGAVVGVELPEQGSEVGTMTLVPGLRLSGQVVDESGSALEGIELVAMMVTSFLSRPSGEDEEARSDKDGRFSFEDLAKGKYSLHTMSSDFETYNEQVDLPLEKPLRVQLRSGRSLKFRITDEQGVLARRPKIATVRPNGGTNSTTWSSGEGELKRLFDKELSLKIADAAGGRNAFAVALGAGDEVLVDAPGVRWDGTTLHVTLERSAGIAGTVTGPRGEAVARGSISVSGQGRSLGWVQVEDGRYEHYGISPGTVQLYVQVEGYPGLTATVEIASRGVTTHDVVLEEGWTVEGVVRARDGQAVSGAIVGLERAGGEPNYVGPGQVVTDETGAFKFEPVASSSYRLVAEKAGFSRTKSVDVIDVRGSVRGVELVLARGTRVFGRVIGAPEGVLGDLRVMARMNDGEMYSAAVAFDGNYELRSIPEGTGLLLLQGRGMAMPRQKSVRISGEEEVEVDFEFGNLRLTGRLTRNGAPAAGLNVGAMNDDMSIQGNTTSDESGNFVIEGLEPAELNLVVSSQTGVVHQEKIILDGDQDVAIEISTIELRGRVTNQAGEAVETAMVTLVRSDGSLGIMGGGSYARTEENGEFLVEMRDPVEGDFAVTVQAEGYSNAVSQWGAGDSSFLELQVGQGFPLEVRWRGSVPDFSQINFVDGNGRVVQQAHVSMGRQTISDAPPGTWTVYAQSELVVVSATVTIRETANDESPNVVELSFPSTGRLELLGSTEGVVQTRRVVRVRLQDASGQPVRWALGGHLGDFLPMMLGQGLPKVAVGAWNLEVLGMDDEGVLFSGPVSIQNGVTTRVEIP